MSEFGISADTAIRVGVFLLFLALFASCEAIFPRRRRLLPRMRRWSNNFSMSAINTAILSLVSPILGSGTALVVSQGGWGLFNWFGVGPLFSIPLYIVAFDLTIYLQHRLFHRFTPLWRLHRVHHTDLDYDVSTGLRFHPLSIVISAAIKFTLIFLLGPPIAAVLLAEVVLNATSMFNHSNIRIPAKIDRVLRLFIVTPDMHRIHHSRKHSEQSCNFGFNFPWWDRLFHTYKAAPDTGHEAMKIGIEGIEAEAAVELYPLLSQPFRRNRENSTY